MIVTYTSDKNTTDYILQEQDLLDRKYLTIVILYINIV